MKIKIILGRFLYAFCKYLPKSNGFIKLGQKQMRRFCGKLILAKCGKGVNIERGSTFSSNCSIGDYSGIGIRANIDGVQIGSHVLMGPDCLILSRNHKFSEKDKLIDCQGYETEKMVQIGDDVWIGARVTILPGVKIGNGAVIGACTVVTKDVPAYSVFCGNPGKVVRFR